MLKRAERPPGCAGECGRREKEPSDRPPEGGSGQAAFDSLKAPTRIVFNPGASTRDRISIPLRIPDGAAVRLLSRSVPEDVS